MITVVIAAICARPSHPDLPRPLGARFIQKRLKHTNARAKSVLDSTGLDKSLRKFCDIFHPFFFGAS